MKTGAIKLQQRATLPAKKRIDSLPHWLMVFPSLQEISDIPYRDSLARRRKSLHRKLADSEPLEIDLANAHGTHVVYACVDENITSFELLTLARKMVAAQKQYQPLRLGIVVTGFAAGTAERIAEALIAASCAAAAQMPCYKSDDKAKTLLSHLELYGLKATHGFRRTFAEAEGNALARYLSILPANELTPGTYLQRVRKLARQYRWTLDFYDQRALRKKQAGAFLAVVQGSAERDAGIVRLRYAPTGKATRGRVVLVGKGICYDTGGTNLKPARSMFGMHEDMQGSAVALGTFLALTRLGVRFPLECWLALAVNHIGPKAYKPNDVITAADGTTIEIVHTDAEGRMVLADTLALASRQKPELIIDYATLTGACVYSLGTAYSGVFSNREYYPVLIKAGRESGERVWPFPLDKDYDKALESNIADVRQCSLEGGVDHILAARFLQRFVKNDSAWIHIDLSAGNRKGGLAHIPTDTTGFGVRYTLNLLLDQELDVDPARPSGVKDRQKKAVAGGG